ncbi:PREDICTED: uncharacterized protein LOC107333685 isoform X1 [Acropora digitifera]|uniref:uncharacterized protein LOC107333685 isoform X1 n=1 Tax=Acropora digitifera TaxID=70779 RepID=UPI00077AE3CB|nr:PREDICTED: uncharacterized protein LOC107333685 isoform X1 [Acropora digitifera]
MIDWQRINIPEMSRQAKTNRSFKLRFDEHQASCYNMAVVNVSLIIISILLSSAQANPTYNETQCKILPIGEEVVVKFQEMAAEKGVRIIYLNTEMENESYHPLESNERFSSKIWVWANTISEPLLSLVEGKDDLSVYSLGLLEYQMRYLKVPLRDQPRGCLARLNTTCQNNFVGQTLLGNFTKVSSDKRLFKAVPADCVCALHIVDSAKLQQVCCSFKNFIEQNNTRLHCEQRAQNTWLQILMGFGDFLKPVLALYSVALPLLLPSWLFNLQYEYEKDKSIGTQINDNHVRPQENDVDHSSNDIQNECEYLSRGGERNIQRERDNESNDEQQSSNQVSTDLEHQRVGSEESGILDRFISWIRSRRRIKTYRQGLTHEQQAGEVINAYGEPLTVIRKDQEALNREIPLDDTSPVTFGGLLRDYVKELPDFNINFNLKMLLLYFVVLPSLLYLKLILIMSHRMESYREFYRRFTNCSEQAIQEAIFCSAIVGSTWQVPLMSWYLIYLIIGCATLFVTLLCVRPKDLIYSYNDRRICLVPKCPSVSLGHEITIHLNILQHWAYDLMFFTLWNYMDCLRRCIMRCVRSKTTLNRRHRVFISLSSFFLFFIGLLLGTVLGAICIVTFIVILLLLIVFLSPSCTLYTFVFVKTLRIIASCVSINQGFYLPIVLAVSFLFSATQFFTSIILNISLAFIVKTFLFTVMGLVLNAELITPYVAFILVVTRNLHLCYSNLQTRYKEVKGMIAEHWKENIRELPLLDKGHDQTIPKELFWFVCGKGKSDFQKNILPLRAEICFMLRGMAEILTLLSVSFFAILVFNLMNDISALVSTTFVFVSGIIPTLLYQELTKKEKFSGWNKIKIEKRIKEAVKEYITKQKEGSLGSDCYGSFH